MNASLRYLDTFVKIEGNWLFSERLLYVDWVDERPLFSRLSHSPARSAGHPIRLVNWFMSK